MRTRVGKRIKKAGRGHGNEMGMRIWMGRGWGDGIMLTELLVTTANQF